jgi:hypothetical protein
MLVLPVGTATDCVVQPRGLAEEIPIDLIVTRASW